MRHAYCIIAHTDPYCLSALLESIDDERNNIYLLYDAKSDLGKFNIYQPKKAKLNILTPDIDIRWGDTSLVKAELKLFEAVINSNINFDFIHLLSGCDLPLHNQDEIYHICGKIKDGINLIGIATDSKDIDDLKYKTEYYHICQKYYKENNKLKRIIFNKIGEYWIKLQKFVGYKREWNDITPVKGSNWVSLRRDFCIYLVNKRDYILGKFRNVSCADEIYKQTMLINSQFKNNMLPDDEFAHRKIDWGRGNPYVWTEKDFPELISGEMLFARKFSSSVDKNIIDLLRQHCSDVMRSKTPIA